MNKFIIAILLLFVGVFYCLDKLLDYQITDSPDQVTASPTTDGIAVNYEQKYESDPILDYDFSPAVYDIPPRYNPVGVINPFITTIEHYASDLRNVKVVKKAAINVPITTLTKLNISKLHLTSVVLNRTFAYAFFTVGKSERCYKTTVGDFIGKKGITIVNITQGKVHLSNGNVLSVQ